MKTILRIDKDNMRLYRDVLFDMESEYIQEMSDSDDPAHWMNFSGFSIKEVGGGYEFTIDKYFAEWAREIDHDCKASPEDGCVACNMFIDLGILPDYEGGDLE